jgi:hypothetical protein
VLAITVTNGGNDPIIGIQAEFTSLKDSSFGTVRCMGEAPDGTGCDQLPGLAACGATNAASATQPVPFCIVDVVISTNAPLQVGGQTTAAENVVGNGVVLQNGASYSVQVALDFANGSTQTQALSVTAQI